MPCRDDGGDTRAPCERTGVDGMLGRDTEHANCGQQEGDPLVVLPAAMVE
jgi:hypothetical protein